MHARRPGPTVSLLGLLALAALLLAGPARAEDDEGSGLKVDRLEYDFGAVGQEQELEATIGYENASTEPIRDIRAIGDCGCYGVTLTHTELEPGEKGTLTVKFRTLMFNGRIVKRLKLLAGTGVYNPTKIKLIVNVIAGVVLAPGRLWFGDVLKGRSPSKTIYAKWHTDAGQPFEIESVEVPGYDFDIEMKPYEQGGVGKDGTWHGWKGSAITFAFKKAPPLGMFSATALVRTNHPDYPRISIPVTANVTGKVWVQTRTIYFGWIPKGKTKKTTLLVKPFADDVDLGEVTATTKNGKVKVTVEEHPMKRPGWWRLLVEVPEGAKEGKLDDVIVVHTAVPGEEETEIQVTGEVLEVGG